MLKQAASVSDRKYRKAKNRVELDTWRAKTWRVGIIPVSDKSAMDRVWMERAERYWNLQARLYGFRHTYPTLHFAEVDGIDIVTTMVRVVEVLPGERVGRKEWTKWRLANPQVQ